MHFFTKTHIKEMIEYNKKKGNQTMVKAWNFQLKVQEKIKYFPKRNKKIRFKKNMF